MTGRSNVSEIILWSNIEGNTTIFNLSIIYLSKF